MSHDDQSDLIDSGPSSEQHVVPRPPTWSSTVPDEVIVAEIVRLARAADLYCLGLTWGEADQDCDLPDVEVDIDVVYSDGHRACVGRVVTPDSTPVLDRWDAVDPPWAIQATRAILSACDVLEGDVLQDVHHALNDGVPPKARWKAANRAFRLLAALIRTEAQWFDDDPTDRTDSNLPPPQEQCP